MLKLKRGDKKRNSSFCMTGTTSMANNFTPLLSQAETGQHTQSMIPLPTKQQPTPSEYIRYSQSNLMMIITPNNKLYNNNTIRHNPNNNRNNSNLNNNNNITTNSNKVTARTMTRAISAINNNIKQLGNIFIRSTPRTCST